MAEDRPAPETDCRPPVRLSRWALAILLVIGAVAKLYTLARRPIDWLHSHAS